MSDGDSSYIRVYKLLLETPRCVAVRQHIEAAYDAVTLTRHEYVLEGTSTTVRFHVSNFGAADKIKFDEDQTPQNILNWHLSAKRHLPDGFLKRIAEQYLGKPMKGPNAVEGAVPTFNVLPEVVLGEKKRKKKGETTESFESWALDRFEIEFDAKRTACIERLVAESKMILADPDLPELRGHALKMLAVRDMVDVLKKWQHLPLALLEEAFQQAVVVGVMDS